MTQPQIQKCSNCGQNKFERVEGIYALTKVEKINEAIAFNPASGVPIIVYICTNCGEIKLYPAKLFGEI